MENRTRNRAFGMLLSAKRHTRYVGILACLALVVAFGVTMGLRRNGRAATITETVLDCHAAAGVAHTHNADCYVGGDLVCPLQERELHVHDESCYDEEGNLVCGKEEAAEEHVHGDGCFKTVTVTVEDEAEPETQMPAKAFEEKVDLAGQRFSASDDLVVRVEAPEGAFPEGTTMTVKAAAKADEQAAESAVEGSVDGKVKKVIAADITFSDAAGNEIQPNVPIKVSIVNDEIAKAHEPVVVHVSDGDAQVVEQSASANDEVAFSADSFSVYAVVIIDKDVDTLEFETDDYAIKVSYTKEAEIPYGTELEVKEITPDQKQYWELRKQTQDKINEGLTWEDTEMTPDPRRGIADAVFFDVTLTYEGKEIEPKVPLAVEISYKEGGVALPEGQTAQVIHFGDKKTEVIKDVKVEKGTDEATSFSFEQDSFSPVGTFTTDKYVEIKSLVSPSAGILAAPALRAEDSSIAAEKTITDTDGDGVYELALRVTGQSESSSTTTVKKSNVVVVVDVSGSMDFNTYTEYKGDGTTQGEYYGKTDNNYHRVYWRNPGGGYRWQYSSGGRYYNYNGTVYFQEPRLDATQGALKELVGALLANNKDEIRDGVSLNDIVEITLVKFAFAQETNNYNGTSTLIRNVNTETEHNQINTIIDNLWAGGGTNWERALAVAKAEADAYKTSQPDEPVSVIFITDGVPTSWGTTNTAGSETASNTHSAWNEADDDARSIVSAGYTLYDIFAFGTDTSKYGNNDGNRTDADYLRALTNYAYSGTGTYANTTLSAAARPYFFNASDTSALQDAFNAIIDSISGNVGFGGVTVNDGVTMGVTSTSVTVDGGVNTNKFRYAIKNGNTTLATVHIEGNNATFTINGTDYPATGQTETTVIDGTTHTNTVFSVTVDGKEYRMSPASFDNNGKVQWDLAGVGIIPNGYTYELTFDVWPNQDAFDTVADLNNGLISFDQVPAEIRNQLVEVDGKYYARTNYEQYVDYYTVDTKTNEQTGETTTTYTPQPRKQLGPKDPVALTSSAMDMRKLWDDSLDQAQLDEILWADYPNNTVSSEYKVTLHVWKADTLDDLNDQIADYAEAEDAGDHDYLDKDLGWNGTEYQWTDSLEVAPGTMILLATAEEMGIDPSKHTQVTYGSKTYVVLESGHYYTVTEDNIDRHFELNTIVYHPMLVDGVLSNVTFKDDGTVDKIEPMSTVVATNTLKGGLNVQKKVFDGEGNDMTEVITSNDTFTVKIEMKNADGTPYEAYDYRIYYGQNNPDGEWDEASQSYGRTGHIYGEPDNGGVIEVPLYIGDVIRVVNVPNGVTYTVTETAYDDSVYTLGANYTFPLETGGETRTFTTDGTGVSYMISKGESDNFVVDGDKKILGNAASQAIVVNTVPTARIQVLKVGDSTTPLANVDFKVFSDKDCTKPVTKDATGTPIPGMQDGVVTTDADGYINLGTMAGTFYLQEVSTASGYNKLTAPIEIKVEKSAGESVVTAACDQEGIVFNTPEWIYQEDGVWTVKVNNTSGKELPMTGGPGTALFNILGSAIAIAAVLTYGLLSRRSSEGRSWV